MLLPVSLSVLLSELLAAGVLLTRLPLGRFVSTDAPTPIARVVWAFPLIGAAVGAAGAAAYAGCAMIGTPPAVSAVWALVAMLLLTGVYHEDGLADTADGFGGGATRERKLAIMRDSRIGGFGAIALMLALAARGTAIAAIGQPLRVATALIVTGALGRAAIMLPLLVLRPARTDGIAVGLQGLDAARAGTAVAIAVALAVLLLPFDAALRGCLGALAGAAAVTWLAHRQIGGYTGDVLGAAEVAAECAAIGLAVSALKL